jgi:hypothetical protein
MKISSKVKDYYDFISHVNGIEEQIVYSRKPTRKKPLTQQDLTEWAYMYDMPRWWRDPKAPVSRWHRWRDPPKYDHYIMLEVGFVQYVFGFKNVVKITDVETDVSVIEHYEAEMELAYTFNQSKHIYKMYPMSLSYFEIDRHYLAMRRREDISFENISVDHILKVSNLESGHFHGDPILKETKVPKFVKPEEIWQNLRAYLGRLVDDSQGQSTPQTDKEKTINHGFDLKTSFRHPVK